MKNIYSMLFCMLIFNIAFSQENNEKVKDTSASKIIEIDEVIIIGNATIDPVFSTVSNNYAERVVQPKNVAELFVSSPEIWLQVKIDFTLLIYIPYLVF